MQNAAFSDLRAGAIATHTGHDMPRWSLLQWLRERRERRQALRLLGEMSDRELKDVGISRPQIEGAVRGWHR